MSFYKRDTLNPQANATGILNATALSQKDTIEKYTTIILKDVTSINPRTFEDNKNLKLISLGNELQLIGRDAFSGCSNLKQIIFPTDLLHIGADAFNGCTNLKYTLNENIFYIGPRAFMNTGHMSKLVIPGCLFCINSEVFADNTYDTVIIEEGVRDISTNAFARTTIGNLYLPSSLSHIGLHNFNRTGIVHYYPTTLSSEWVEINISGKYDTILKSR